MQALTVVSPLPVYLPADQAQVPFGDPLSDVTITSSTTAVVTVPGYDAPVAGDKVAFSVPVAAPNGTVLASGLVVGTPYFVVAPISGDTFAVSATKGGSAIATTTSNSTAGQVTIHLLSQQIYGTFQPFKPNNTVVALNLQTSSQTLQGASDVNGGAGNPGGPGTWNVIATVAAGAAALVQLSYDWIRVSSTAGNLILLQN